MRNVVIPRLYTLFDSILFGYPSIKYPLDAGFGMT